MKERLQRLAEQLPAGVEAALITSDVSRRYLTGMRSSAGTVVVFCTGEAYLLIDSRYVEKARKTASGCEVLLQTRRFQQLSELFERHGCRHLAVESDALSLTAFLELRERLNKVEIAMDPALSRLLGRMRMIKSSEELKAIQAAQQITDLAFTHLLDYIRPGRTEREIAGELLDFCYRQGSEGPSFDPIVVSGVNSSMPHGVPTDKPVQAGEFITMDFGCVVDGYCSDMTRTVAIGSIDSEQRDVYETVLQAQQAALDLIRPGLTGQQVDAAARNCIAGAGYGDCFGHGTGHSLGLEIHEAPSSSPSDETVLEPGMLMTIEPGIYLEGEFGVRIEDLVVLTENGRSNLTASPKEILLL